MTFIARQWKAKRAILAKAQQVRARTGKSVATQLREMVALRYGPGRLKATDYFAYHVYDDAIYSAEGKRQVLSWNAEWLANRVNSRAWRALCDDKLLFYGFLTGLDVPYPEVYAAFDGSRRTCGRTPMLWTDDAAAAFLRDRMTYPFFGKPIRDSFGRRVSFVESIDRERDVLTFVTGEQVPVRDYVRDYVVAPNRGYIFQAPIRQHEVVHRVCGGRAATLRMIVLNGDDGPELFRVIWRIPVGRNITDNFLGGMQGNLISHVDPATGRVGKIIQAVSFEGDARGETGYEATRIDVHPDTGERLRDLQLPQWDLLVSRTLETAAAFSGVRFQSWDVAIGPDGPQFLELNYHGGIRVIQVPGFGGLYDARFQSFWQRYASPR